MPSVLETRKVDSSAVRPSSTQRLLFSLFCKSTSWDSAGLLFQTEGQKLLQEARALPHELLSRKVQVGYSRHWSAEMVLEHLIELGTIYAEVIVHLSHGESPWHEIDPAMVIPEGGAGSRILGDYSSFLNDFASVLSEDVGGTETALTHPHPYYGELTAHGWLCLAAFHQRVHCDQIEQIVASLRS
jgi:hypothetical protein